MTRPTPEDSFSSRMTGREKFALLRPMESGEIIDTALRIYQRNFWTALKLTVVPASICQAAISFVAIVVIPALLSTQAPGNSKVEAGELVVALGVALLVAVPLFCFGMGRMVSLMASLGAASIHGLKVDPAFAENRANRSTSVVMRTIALMLFWALLLIFVSGLIAFLGMLLENSESMGEVAGATSSIFAILALIAGMIALPFVARATALAPVIATLEIVKPRDALKRSRRLIKHHYGQGSSTGALFLTAFSLSLIATGLGGSLAFLVEATHLASVVENWSLFPGLGQISRIFVESLPTFLVLWVLGPAWAIVLTALYYDRIVRLEAYDVKVMIDDLSRAERRPVLLR